MVGVRPHAFDAGEREALTYHPIVKASPECASDSRPGVRRALTILFSLFWATVAMVSSAAIAADKTVADLGVAPHRAAKNLVIITIEGEIDSIMARSIERRVEAASKGGADAIVFEIDSPGGEVGAVLRICNAIKASPIKNTIAWIRRDAYSGGAIVALACREIVVNDPCTFGDAQAVGIDPLRGIIGIKDKEALKKVLPPLISEVLDSARRHNATFNEYIRDEYLVQSIIANDVELWLIRNNSTGLEMCIDKAEFAMLFPGQTPAGKSRLPDATGTATGVQDADAAPVPQTGVPAGSEKLAAIAGIVGQNQTAPSSRPRLTEADRGQWTLVEKVSAGNNTALFKTEDMVHFRLAANYITTPAGGREVVPIRSRADAQALVGASNVRIMGWSWSEYLVKGLTNFIVRGLLIVVFLIALGIEMTHPGAVLPGAIAAIALVTLLAPPMLIGMAGWWELAAILVGIVLIAIEIFIFPGFGLPGILGLLLLFVGLVGTFTRSDSLFPGSAADRGELYRGLTVVILALASSGVGIYFVAKHFSSIPILNRLILRTANDDEDFEGQIIAAMDPDPMGEAAARVGEVGEAMTPLRPAGRVAIGDRVVDAVADFGFIDSGARVRVVSVSAMRVAVEVVRDA